MDKKQGFAPILLIIVALIVAIGGIGAGLAWKTNVLDKWLPQNVKEFFGKEVTPTNGEQPNGEEEPTNGEEPTSEDPTKDWKVYSRAQYGYSFKYPSDWVVSLSTSSEIKLGNPDNQAVEGVGIIGPDESEAQGAVLYYENSGSKSAEAFIRDLIGRSLYVELFPVTTKFVSLGDRTWVKATVDGPGMEYALRDIYYTAVRGDLVFYFIASAEVDDNGNLVRNYDKTELEILELVVSSFDFTE